MKTEHELMADERVGDLEVTHYEDVDGVEIEVESTYYNLTFKQAIQIIETFDFAKSFTWR